MRVPFTPTFNEGMSLNQDSDRMSIDSSSTELEEARSKVLDELEKAMTDAIDEMELQLHVDQILLAIQGTQDPVAIRERIREVLHQSALNAIRRFVETPFKASDGTELSIARQLAENKVNKQRRQRQAEVEPENEEPTFTEAERESIEGWFRALFYFQMMHKVLTYLSEEGAIRYMILKMEQLTGEALKDRDRRINTSNARKHSRLDVLFSSIYGEQPTSCKDPLRVTLLDCLAILYTWRTYDLGKASDSTIGFMSAQKHGGNSNVDVSKKIVKTGSRRISNLAYFLYPENSIVGAFLLLLMNFTIPDSYEDNYKVAYKMITLLTTSKPWEEVEDLKTYPFILEHMGPARSALLQGMVRFQLPFLGNCLERILIQLVRTKKVETLLPFLSQRLTIKGPKLALKYRHGDDEVLIQAFNENNIDVRFTMLKDGRDKCSDADHYHLGVKSDQLRIPLTFNVNKLLRLDDERFEFMLSSVEGQICQESPSFDDLEPRFKNLIQRAVHRFGGNTDHVPRSAFLTAALLGNYAETEVASGMIKSLLWGFMSNDAALASKRFEAQIRLIRGFVSPVKARSVEFVQSFEVPVPDAESGKDLFEAALEFVDDAIDEEQMTDEESLPAVPSVRH